MITRIFCNWYSRVKSRISNSSFIKSVMTLSAGVVVSQAISIFTMPIISRIYSPEIIGDFAIISSSTSIIGILVSLGLMPAIMVPVDNDEAKGICRLLAFSITGISSALCLFAILFSGLWRIFDVSLPYWIACLVLWGQVILTNISSVCYAYVNRQKMYKALFWNPTIGTVTNATISISLGLLNCGLAGYLSGILLSSLFVLIHMLKSANPFKGKISESLTPLKLLKKHKDFPLVMLPSEFLGTFAAQMPVQMISKFWGSFALGSYSMCMSVLAIPTKFLAAPVNRVFYREAYERLNKGSDIGEFTFRLLKANIKLAIIPISLLILLGPELFSFVLGQKWFEAGIFASILGVYQLTNFCNSCISGKFIIINKKKTILTLNIVYLILNFCIFYVCHFFELGIVYTILVFSLVGSLFSMVDTAIFMKQANIGVIKYLKFVLLYLIIPTSIATLLRLMFRPLF